MEARSTSSQSPCADDSVRCDNRGKSCIIESAPRMVTIASVSVIALAFCEFDATTKKHVSSLIFCWVCQKIEQDSGFFPQAHDVYPSADMLGDLAQP